MISGTLGVAPAQWIAYTGAGSLGARAGMAIHRGDIQVTPPGYSLELLSGAVGRNIFAGFGLAVGAKLVELGHPLVPHRASRVATPVYLYVTHGVGLVKNRVVPNLYLHAGIGNAIVYDPYELQVYATVGVKAEWLFWGVVSPAVELEWEDAGPVATMSIGIGRWWTFGR